MPYTAVKGMHDLLPPASDHWIAVESTVRDICDRYGFHEIRTPIVEKTPLFVRGVGENTAIVEKEMYSFTDQGDEQLTLRPEGTAPVVRAYIEAGLGGTDPLAKLYYIGPMFRHERPQKGRYRQFHQFGVENLGTAHPHADVEAIALLMRFLGAVGLQRVNLQINSLGCAVCRPGYVQVLVRMLVTVSSALCEECQRRIPKNPLRVFDCKNPDCRRHLDDLPSIVEYWCGECKTHFQSVREGLDALTIAYVVNTRIARGLDYYMRTAFEVIAEGLGAQNALGGGGRYDGLVKALGGPDVPGVGFAIGMERLMLLLDAAYQPTPARTLFVATIGAAAHAMALPLVEQLRATGCRVEWDYENRSLKSQMRRADKVGAKIVVIIGAEELKQGKAIVRDMGTKEQTTIPLKELVVSLRKNLLKSA